MTTFRVTHSMLGQRSLDGLQAGLSKLAEIQEHLATGRIINRPSDDPAGATSAMQVRSSLAAEKQYLRNADNGIGWLTQIDSSLQSATDQVRRARELALQGANGSMGPAAREALAAEVDQIREGLIATANATYLDRPVFGGITAGDAAYDATTGAWVGTTHPNGVQRTVGDGVTVRVDVEGLDVFGVDDPAGTPPTTSVFTHLADLSAALRAGDQAGIEAAIGTLKSDGERFTTTLADVGTRQLRIEQAKTAATDKELGLKNNLSEIENADLAKTVVELQLQEVAYQAALAATGRVMQPSLLEFLR